jgi:hypothetical protein
MSTPEENFETTMDGSSDPEARETAIGELETANDCDRLAELARSDDVEDRDRERALFGLAHPQCKPTLRSLVADGDLPSSLHEQAGTLVEETPDGAGAGPS